MKLALIFVLVFSLSGCAALQSSGLIRDLKSAGCEFKTVHLKDKETLIECMGFNIEVYKGEKK